MTEVNWHLNKTVTVAILAILTTVAVALVGIAAQGLWFASKMDARVTTLEEQRKADLKLQELRDERQDKAGSDADNQQLAYLIRIERTLNEALLAGRLKR